jgi:hypothetical protein
LHRIPPSLDAWGRVSVGIFATVIYPVKNFTLGNSLNFESGIPLSTPKTASLAVKPSKALPDNTDFRVSLF